MPNNIRKTCCCSARWLHHCNGSQRRGVASLGGSSVQKPPRRVTPGRRTSGVSPLCAWKRSAVGSAINQRS